MKKLIILCVSLCWFATACVADDPDIADEEGAVLVSTPDAGLPPIEGIISEWCELHPWDARCDDQGSDPGGGSGGGGSGGGGSSGGDPLPCLGSNNNWCATHQRCERYTACTPQEAGVPFEDAICQRSHGDGRCWCLY